MRELSRGTPAAGTALVTAEGAGEGGACAGHRVCPPSPPRTSPPPRSLTPPLSPRPVLAMSPVSPRCPLPIPVPFPSGLAGPASVAREERGVARGRVSLQHRSREVSPSSRGICHPLPGDAGAAGRRHGESGTGAGIGRRTGPGGELRWLLKGVLQPGCAGRGGRWSPAPRCLRAP